MARPTAFLVHSIGGQASNWDTLLPYLNELECVGIDLPGHGASSLPVMNTAQDYARHLEDTRIAMSVEKVLVIGQSMGGTVVQCYARDYPASCLGAVIANSAAHFSVTEERLRWIEEDWPAAARDFAQRQVSRHGSEAQREQARQMVAQRNPSTLVHDLRTCNAFSAQEWAASVHVPVLVITGDEDPSYGPVRARELHALYPKAQLRIIERCGHNPVLEQPLAFAAAVNEFVSGL